MSEMADAIKRAAPEQLFARGDAGEEMPASAATGGGDQGSGGNNHKMSFSSYVEALLCLRMMF